MKRKGMNVGGLKRKTVENSRNWLGIMLYAMFNLVSIMQKNIRFRYGTEVSHEVEA